MGPPTAKPPHNKSTNNNTSHYGADTSEIGGLGKADGIVPQWNIIQVHHAA